MQQPPPIPDLLEALSGFATAVADSTSPVDNINWQWRPAADEWSLGEVMCHLRDVEQEVHQARFQLLMMNDTPFISGVVSDEWAQTRAYFQQDGRAACAAFLSARQETVDFLQQLDEVSWQRYGRHAFFGPTTLHELVNLVVKHDAVHWQQILTLLPFATQVT